MNEQQLALINIIQLASAALLPRQIGSLTQCEPLSEEEAVAAIIPAQAEWTTTQQQ
jgi:hypothetical protein